MNRALINQHSISGLLLVSFRPLLGLSQVLLRSLLAFLIALETYLVEQAEPKILCLVLWDRPCFKILFFQVWIFLNSLMNLPLRKRQVRIKYNTVTKPKIPSPKPTHLKDRDTLCVILPYLTSTSKVLWDAQQTLH